MNGLLHVSSSPHARSKVTTDKIMFAVLLALAPAACVGVWNFGLRALLLIAISMAVCPLTEYLYEKGMKKPVTIADGSRQVFAPALIVYSCIVFHTHQAKNIHNDYESLLYYKMSLCTQKQGGMHVYNQIF